MNNGDTMVDVSTAYMAIDFARDDERGKTADVINSWKAVEDILPHDLERVLVKMINRNVTMSGTLYKESGIPKSAKLHIGKDLLYSI